MSAAATTLRGDVLTISPGSLYWALLDIPAPAGRSGEEALRYAFEPHLPAPLDEVEMRFIPLNARSRANRGGRGVRGGSRRGRFRGWRFRGWRVRGPGRWLACGIEHARLAELIDAAESNVSDAPVRVESVVPASLPEALGHLDSANADLRGLEFRTGVFESPRRARRRTTMAWSALGAAACASALLTGGLLLGAEAHHEIARDAHASSRALAAHALHVARGGDPTLASDQSTLPASVDPRLVLGAELRRAEQSRLAQRASLGLVSDRTDALLSILSRWPSDPASRVDELRVDQGSATIRGLVREATDAERLASIVAADAWTIGAVQASRAAQGYSMSLVLRDPPPESFTPPAPEATSLNAPSVATQQASAAHALASHERSAP